jgi:hypothetical protein
MSCEKRQSNEVESDCLEVKAVTSPFDESPTAWILGMAMRYLNTAGKEGEFEYARVVKALRNCSNDDLLKTVLNSFRQAKGGDTTLRWNLLYVLGDVGDESSAEFLKSVALNPLPEKKNGECCESDRDMEMLVSTGAVHALHRVATRHPNVSDNVLDIISQKPDQPILIEAVKVAAKLGIQEKAQKLLPEEDHWIFTIRQAQPQELFAKPEREDEKERGFTPPKSGALYTAPKVSQCKEKEG